MRSLYKTSHLGYRVIPTKDNFHILFCGKQQSGNDRSADILNVMTFPSKSDIPVKKRTLEKIRFLELITLNQVRILNI